MDDSGAVLEEAVVHIDQVGDVTHAVEYPDDPESNENDGNS